MWYSMCYQQGAWKCRSGGIGRRPGLKIPWERSRAGSTPVSGTIYRGVEQLAARRAHNPEAAGSSPAPATIKSCNRKGYRTFIFVSSRETWAFSNTFLTAHFGKQNRHRMKAASGSMDCLLNVPQCAPQPTSKTPDGAYASAISLIPWLIRVVNLDWALDYQTTCRSDRQVDPCC